MNEVQFLFASEPCKPLKPRFLSLLKNLSDLRLGQVKIVTDDFSLAEWDIQRTCDASTLRGRGV